MCIPWWSYTLRWFIDSLHEHSRYIVGAERVQHMDCVEHVEHSLKYVQNVYML